MGGMQMQMLARSFLVYDLTGSAVLLGVVNAGSAIPMLTLVLFGGVIADRVDRKKIIQVGQFAAAGLSLAVGVAIATATVTWYHLLKDQDHLQMCLWHQLMLRRESVPVDLLLECLFHFPVR